MRKNTRLLSARTADILSSVRRTAVTLLLMMLTTMTAWADDVNLAEDNDIAEGTAGHYYVNMPATGTNTLTITAQDIADGKGTFKVYDDGGKSVNYSNDCNGNLVLKAPTGYVFQLSGNIKTGGINDKLTVYDNNEASGTKLIDAVYSPAPDYNNIAIYTVTSTSTDMTLNFTTDFLSNYAGLDLTVSLVNTSTEYNVIVDNSSATGGSVASNKEKANVNETVTLTATPASSDYLFNGISVTGANSNAVAAAGGWYSNNQATFTMPGSAVTVTPTFTNDLTNLSVNMPKTGEKDVIIPSYVQSFKVYDDGGKDGNYSQNCTGTLVLTAPEGYVLQLSGSVTLDYNNEKLTVYNGTKANDDKLIDAFSCSESNTKTDIPMATSKGNVMTIYFETNNFYEYAGLDLTVTLVSASTDYTINGLGPATGGSISASVGGENATTAKANDVVTLMATPESNYLFNGISVKDASNNVIAVTWDGMFNNTATFTMPGSNVTITPTFTNDLTNLSVNMPKTGSKSVTIPSYVQSIKVYDDGGSGSAYSPSCDGTLVLTAPTGYLLQLSGSISSEKYHDMLTVYDNSEASGTKLIDEVTSPSGSETAVIYPVFSSGNVMTLKFVSDSGWNYDGFDLTVTIVNPNTEYNVNVVNPAEGGSVTASPTSAKVNATVTLTATPDNEYLPSGFSVKDANNNDIAVTWAGPFSNTATFTMPGSNVTVTPTFSDDLTNLFVNMPKTGSKSITIPSGVQSFKVYDDGGSSSDYSTSCNGTLVLTAPTGYVLQLSGGITTEGADKLTVYNGSTTSSTKLIDAMGGSGSTKKDIEPVTSSSNVMMINFKSDNSINYAGLDLTVTLVPSYTITYNLNSGTNATGNPTTYTANTETFILADPSREGYVFLGWFSDAEFNTPATTTITKGSTGNLTFWAKWGKNIANCTATVPDQVVSPYGYSFNDIGSKFDYANNNVGKDYAAACIEDIGAVVMDGSKTLVFGTDYEFGTVAGKTGNETSQVGDEYTVEIKGKGDYSGTTTASFKIKNPGGTWGDLTWSLASGTLTITGDGTMNTATTYNGYGFPWVNYRSQINSVVIGEGITSIADKAFGETHNQEKYENVTAITLPSTLTSIGANAFNGCTNSSLNITIPTSVTSVGEGAFNTQASVTATLSESIDNTSLLAALKGVTTNLTFKRTFDANTGGEGKASTVCLPFDLAKPAASVGKFYTFGGVSNTTGEYVVTMNEVSGDELSAGTPYLFKPVGGSEVTFQNSAYRVPVTGIKAVTSATNDGWEFKGTYEEITWPDGQTRLYAFAASNFEKSDGSLLNDVGAFRRYDWGHANPFRCYLWAPDPSTARGVNGAPGSLPQSLKVVLVSASGETTGIGTLDNRTGEVTFGDEWYSLDGQKLDGKPTKKGLYINKGNKVIIK